MTRLRRAVVFIGGSRDIATALQRAVTGNVRTLARAGVLVPKAGRRATNRGGLSHQKLATPGGPDWESLDQELRDATGETVLLVIPALLRMGGAVARHRAVVAQLNTVADEVVIVSVVADQLTLINEYYLHHVATWRTSARLENLASKLFHNEVFVHERLLRPWYEETSVRYVAVPHNEYAAANPLQVVLEAVGVSLPDAPGPAPGALTLGSVGVEANRLLSTYLRAEIPDFRPDAKPVSAASRAGLARVEKLGWCADEFWGWTPRSANKALGRFDASNQRFARTVWGTDWPLGYPMERAGTQLDFLDLDVQEIDQVHSYVVSMADRLAAELEGGESMRLVLHAGAEFADSGAVHRDLVAHRNELRAAGVALPRRDDLPSWRETAVGLVRGDPDTMALIAEARADDAEVLLVSSDLVADALASPHEAARLAARAAAEGLDVRVVVVVREQVGYINSLYCQRILNLDTARGLPEFAALAVPAHRFDYVASFGAIADTDGLELVAVPYPEIRAVGAGRRVVEEAGLSGGAPDALVFNESSFVPLPGPILIGATRLLHKRLRHLNSFHEQGKGPLRALAGKLATRALAAGWDDTEYWGWDGALRRAVMEEYAESNTAFAEFVWGTPWPEQWSAGRPRRADLADLDPPVLRDVMTTVDRLVEEADPKPTDPSDA